MGKKSYVLITPTRNEEGFIGRTIESVIHQTQLPKKWIIVSDGSTDHTDEIVKSYMITNPFIRLLRAPGDEHRNFSSKACAIREGYDQLKHLEYDFIGNLDADITFNKDYYEKVLAKFENNEKLGIAGGVIYQHIKDNKYVGMNISENSVSGAVQLFRRACFEEIGGYTPLENGGIDAAAEIRARMNGWEVRHYTEIKAFHNRKMGSSKKCLLIIHFSRGIMYYRLGYHPLFQFFRYLSRLKDKPIIIGSTLEFIGYVWAAIGKYEIQLPRHVIEYLRSEQLSRIKKILVK